MNTNHITTDDLVVKFQVEPIGIEDHYTRVKAHFFVSDDNFFKTKIGKIGFAEMVQLNFSNALDEDYHWLSLIDEINDDMLDLFKPIVATGNTFTDEFSDFLDDKCLDANSVIAIERIFIKKEFRGKRLLGGILKAIRKFNYCPIILSPVPLQHATGESNKKLMGYEGKRKEAKKDFKKLSVYYESNGFKRISKSKTWVLV